MNTNRILRSTKKKKEPQNSSQEMILNNINSQMVIKYENRNKKKEICASRNHILKEQKAKTLSTRLPNLEKLVSKFAPPEITAGPRDTNRLLS